MRKVLFALLIFLSLVLIGSQLGSNALGQILNLAPHAGLKIESSISSDVSIDKKPLGKTPLQKEDLKSGEHLVSLTSDNGSWQGYVNLTPGTLTVINRELSPSQASSSGEIIGLGKGGGVVIVSNPDGSDVAVDSKPVGKTPLSISDISSGEHLFLISHPNYLNRSIRAVVVSGYSLNMSVDLAITEANLAVVPTPIIPVSPQVIVKQTPTGFLRVRDNASINGAEIGRVSSGDTLDLIEEQSGWDKVRLSDGKEGFVSTQYVEKK